MCKHKSGGMSRPQAKESNSGISAASANTATLPVCSSGEQPLQGSGINDVQRDSSTKEGIANRQQDETFVPFSASSGKLEPSCSENNITNGATSESNLPEVHIWDGTYSDSAHCVVCNGSSQCTMDASGLPHPNIYVQKLQEQSSSSSSKLTRSNSASFKGTGCSVLLESTPDLIELTEEPFEAEYPVRTQSTSHSDKAKFFPQNLCRSFDNPRNSVHKTLSNPVIRVGRSMQHSSDPNRHIHRTSCGENSNAVNAVDSPGTSGLQRPNSIHCDTELGDDEQEEDFRRRSFSLTPTINLAIFENDSLSEAEDEVPEAKRLCELEENDTFCEDHNVERIPLPVSTHKTIVGSSSAAQLSLASSLGEGGLPICKICHMTSKDGDPLISPCKCSGTMQYIHCGCLMRWLEILNKKSRKPPSCELCQYQYHWHKKFKVRHWQFPHCSRRDKILHALFFISVVIMVACATITIMCFKQDSGRKQMNNDDRAELTESEIITLVCGVLFFLAFFVAMYVEVTARNTIYKLLLKFIYLNQQWYIDEYDKKESAPVAV